MKVGVVGGGITGMVAARVLARRGHSVTLFESSNRLGGLIQTHEVGDALVEGAADWFVTRTPEALSLVEELGLTERLVEPAVAGAAVFADGRLKALPKGTVRGVPVSFRQAASSKLVGPLGALRTLGDYLLPGPLSGPDVAIGPFLRKRLGAEVVERLVDPMLAASRSGTIDEVSLATGAPELDQAARSNRSVMRGARALAAAAGDSPFRGLRGGMRVLIEALAADLGPVEVRLDSEVTALMPGNGGWEIRLDGGSDTADAVVVATPPHRAGTLLARSAPGLAEKLGSLASAPAVVVGLVYEEGRVQPPADLSGFLVPSGEAAFVTAGAWFSSKWPHARGAGGQHVIRCFVGRTEGDERVTESDSSIIARARRDVARIMGVTGEPQAHIVLRHDRALPVFRVGHSETVDEIERGLDDLPPVALAGAGYRGSGIPDCIRSAQAAAAAIT